MNISLCKKTVYGTIIGIVVSVFMAMPAYSEELKIGYVDSQRILDESIRGKQIIETLNEYVQSRQKIVDIEEGELRRLQEEVAKQGAVLSPDAKQQKEEQFQKMFMEYQKKVTALQKEIQQRRTEKLEEFNNELETVVRIIGEKEEYSIVLNNLEVNIIIYAKPSLNLTDRVIEEMDKDLQKK